MAMREFLGKYSQTLFLVLFVLLPNASAQGEKRPLDLPDVGRGQACPVSTGSLNAVPHVPYIFCASCLFFGKGPVYFAWAFPVDDPQKAIFELDGAPKDHSWFTAKTVWVADRDYSGSILIRGRRLDAKGKLMFAANGSKATENFVLSAPERTDPSHWSFWPSYTYVQGPGCYGIQIDTQRGSSTVIFSIAPLKDH